MQRGIFITFEGGEGVGKSTQIELLSKALQKKGYPLFVTREPGGTEVGEKLRKILKTCSMNPKTELLVLEASRAELVEREINPKLRSGYIVLCDRYVESALVYQGMVRGLPIDQVHAANDLATGGLSSDFIILLDEKSTVNQKRLKKRQGKNKNIKDRFDQEPSSFHLKVQRAFRTMAKQDSRFHLYNSHLSRQALHKMILRDVEKLIRSHKKTKS